MRIFSWAKRSESDTVWNHSFRRRIYAFFYLKYPFLALLFAFCSNLSADDHSESAQAGPNAVANMLTFCSLKDGKTNQDLQKALSALETWASEHHPGTVAVMTPFIRTAGSQFGDVMIQSFVPFTGIGEMIKRFNETGGKAQEAMGKALNCERMMGSYYPIYTHPDLAGPNDFNTVYSVQNCSPHEGVTPQDVFASAQASAKSAEEAGVAIHTALLDPNLGARASRDPDGFGRVIVFRDMDVFGQVGDWYANQGGWESAKKYSETIAECNSPNVYFVDVLKFAETGT